MAWPTTTINTTQMDAGTDDASQARAQIKQMADNVNDIKDSRGAASGIAPLGGDSKVPTDNLPTQPVSKGGTGQTTYTIGDILYASAAGVLTKLPAATAGFVLTSNGAGAAPSWQLAGGGLTSGTRMLFNQTTAPTGWTKDTDAALNDSILRIVTGTVSQGGSQAFSDFNGIDSTGAHTLTTAEIPSHNHGISTRDGGLSGSFTSGIKYESSFRGSFFTVNSNNAGSNGSHSHGLTVNIKYNDFIVCEKD